MNLVLITAPTEEPVGTAAISEHLRISGSAESELLGSYLTAARQYLESAQRRAYCTQTWDLYFDEWPRGPIYVPLPPLQSVTHVIGYHTGGTAATVATSVYQVDSVSEPGRVSLAYGNAWPSHTLRSLNGFVIRFVAGEGTAGDVSDVHKLMIKELAGHYYENREAASETRIEPIPLGLQSLLWTSGKQVRL